MRRTAALWAVLAAGCTTADLATKEELRTVRDQLLAHNERKASELKGELTGVDQKYVKVQQIEMQVEKKLEELRKLQESVVAQSEALARKIDVANSNVLKVLEFEEALLSDRLSRLRLMIKELQEQKKP